MNLFLIDKNENVIGVVPDGKIIDLTQSLEINQADVLNGTITLDKSLRLDEVRYFAVPDRDNPHNLWMYRKTVVKVENDDILIQGVNAFYDDLKAYGYIKDKRPNKINAEQAVRLVVGNTRWNVDFVDTALNSSTAEIHDTNFYYLTYLDAIKSIEDTWTVEIQPFINIEGNKITRKYVNLYQQMGGNKGKRFVYGENALQIVKESNDTDVYTALIGRGSGIAEQDDQGNDTGGYSRKITFADVEWSKAKGDPVDKPLGQEWIEWPQATKEFGYSDGTPRFGIVEFQNEEDPVNLLKETWDNLQKSAIPSVQFSATVGDVGFLSLGETIAIVRYDLDIKYQTRVIKIDWNRKNEKASQITLGDKLVQSAADRYRSVQAEAYKARDIADRATNQANFAIDNGGNTIQWGSFEPVHPKEGDLWYDKQPDGTVVMKRYENGQWIILIDDTTGEQIKNKVDKAEEDVKQLKIDADNAQTIIDNRLKQNETKLSGLDSDIKNVDTKADNIKITANSAIAVANDTKNGLLAKVDSSTFNSSMQQIDNAIQTKVSNTDYQSKITQLADGIQSNVNNIDGLRQNTNSQITQLSNSINTKVSNADFVSRTTQLADGINSTVQKIDGLKVGGTNLLPHTKNFENWTSWGSSAIELDPKLSYKNFSVAHLWGDHSGFRWENDLPLEKGKQYTISVWLRGLNGGSINVNYYDAYAGAVPITSYVTDQWQRYSMTFTAKDPDLSFGNRRNIEAWGYWGNVWGSIYVAGMKLEEGNIATDWSPSPNDLASQSQVTQLVNNINLRVQKNEVINQINISPEGILIDGRRTHITGQTVIDNAAIKDAAISNLSASKLTAGLINCRQIDVMNIAGYQIMANQITADKMAANAIMVGLNNSLTNLSIVPYGINITENGRNVLTFNKTGIRVSDSENNEEVGWIHANHAIDAHWFNGLQFDLDELGDYMGWGVHNNNTNLYDLKIAYYKNPYGGIEADSFISSASINIFPSIRTGKLVTLGQGYLNFRNAKINGGEDAVELSATWGIGCGFYIAGDHIYVKTAGGVYDLDKIIHSIGRNQTWN